MKRLGIALTTVAALALGGLAALPAQADESGPSITGTVTLDKKPVANKSVEFAPVKKGQWASVYTNDNGTYNTADPYTGAFLTPGTYTASVQARTWQNDNFLTTYYGNTVREPDAKRITLGANTAAKVNIKAKAAGTATGKVVNAKGKPVANANVSLTAKNRYGYGYATTNKAGKYTVRGLPTDSYDVSAYRVLKSGAYSDGGLKKSVKVTAGKTRKLATIKMPAVGTATIKGKVTGARSMYSGQGAVTLESKNHIAFAALDKKGNVKVGGLPAGTYKVSLNGANLSKKVKVAKGKTKSFGTMKRAKGKTISGVVKTSKNKRARGVTVTVHDDSGTWLGTAVTNSKGKYTVKGATKGKYMILTNVNSTSQSGAKPKTVTVKKGKNTKVNFKLVRTGTITGKIVNSKNKAVAGVAVNALTAGNSFGSYETATTNSKGVYTIKGVRPGKYTITTSDQFMGGYYNGSSKKVVKVKSAKKAKGPKIKLRS